MIRRKPVPREFREQHILTTRSHAWGSGWQRTSRTRGRCSCGAQFPESENTDNLDYADCVDAWKDHVAQAYHGEDFIATPKGAR